MSAHISAFLNPPPPPSPRPPSTQIICAARAHLAPLATRAQGARQVLRQPRVRSVSPEPTRPPPARRHALARHVLPVRRVLLEGHPPQRPFAINAPRARSRPRTRVYRVPSVSRATFASPADMAPLVRQRPLLPRVRRARLAPYPTQTASELAPGHPARSATTAPSGISTRVTVISALPGGTHSRPDRHRATGPAARLDFLVRLLRRAPQPLRALRARLGDTTEWRARPRALLCMGITTYAPWGTTGC